MDILIGKFWLLTFSVLMLSPMLYNIVKAEGRAFGNHSTAIFSVFCMMLAQFVMLLCVYFESSQICIYLLKLVYQILVLFSCIAVFYMILNELKEKYLRYSNTNEWRYLFPGIAEGVLLIILNILCLFAKPEPLGLYNTVSSLSLYLIVNFYIIVGALLCYKSYRFNLDFDIKYIALKHFYYYLVLCLALFIQQAVFQDVEIGFSFAVFLFFNYMARSRTLISQDPLSGVNNRVSFSKYINNVFVNRDHNGAFIIFIDIDRFKIINDTYGHIEGDEIISTVGKTLKSIAGEFNAFVARIGGDEFILVCQGQSEEAVKDIINNISYELEERLIFLDKKYDVTLSCGYVYAPPNARNIKDLISRADKEMYMEKSRKKENNTNAVL